jgi:hypothetical protein
MVMERDFPPAAKLDAKFPSLSDALRLSFSELSGDLDKLQSRLVDVEREVALSQKEEGSMEWAEKMATFLSRARIEVQKNKDALGEAIAEISSVMTRYAVDTRAAGEKRQVSAGGVPCSGQRLLLRLEEGERRQCSSRSHDGKDARSHGSSKARSHAKGRKAQAIDGSRKKQLERRRSASGKHHV